MSETPESFLDLAADIVSAYVRNHSLTATDLPTLIVDVHVALQRAAVGVVEPVPEVLKPAVPIKKSVTPSHVICLEDGKKFKSLRRHLRTEHGMSIEEYRERWSLPPDYPVVAPAYTQARSNIAKQMGFGQKTRASSGAVSMRSAKAKR
jgi:predicted transcriptional regulator